jgi:hypothetical protein
MNHDRSVYVGLVVSSDRSPSRGGLRFHSPAKLIDQIQSWNSSAVDMVSVFARCLADRGGGHGRPIKRFRAGFVTDTIDNIAAPQCCADTDG